MNCFLSFGVRFCVIFSTCRCILLFMIVRVALNRSIATMKVCKLVDCAAEGQCKADSEQLISFVTLRLYSSQKFSICLHSFSRRTETETVFVGASVVGLGAVG
jgi:hypothetical protein